LLLGVWAGEAWGQLDTQWVKRYDGYSADAVNDHIQTSDGGFALTGYSSPVQSPTIFLSLIRCDANGDSVWGKFFRAGAWTRGYSIHQTEDAGFFLFGYVDVSVPDNGEHDDIIAIRTNSEGDSLWGHRFTGIGETTARCAVRTSAGNYALGGTISATIGGTEDMFLLMLDENGDSLWSRSYGGRGVQICNDIIETSDGGFALAGSINSVRNGPQGYWVLFVNENGDSLDSYIEGYPNTDYSTAYTIQELQNGIFVVSGLTAFPLNFPGESFIWTVGLNARHNRIWQRLDGERVDRTNQYALSSCLTSDGMVALTGYYCYNREHGQDDYRYWTQKIEPNGDLEYYKFWGADDHVSAYSIIQTDDGSYSIAGAWGYLRTTKQFLLKTTPDPDWSDVNPFEAPHPINDDFSVYPNPTNGIVRIQFVSNQSNANLLIFDSTGRQIFHRSNITTNSIWWNPEGITTGSYFVSVRGGGKVYSRRLVLGK